ncbi:RabGAP/TBC [Trichodelitschia bisporula]|uniref:RabGAP/TBC n=1 Tax=Trichodelitschia bisporula TaxID=703511 RepID=A0A6G1I5P5_9PEZI|nr:RabGAP/TBC [Trichodelitschia bisporula]
MRSPADAKSSLQQLDSYTSLADLRAALYSQNDRDPDPLGSRSLCWKIFLLFQTLDRSAWPSILADSRSAYESLRSHLLRAIEHPEEAGSEADPLSDNQDSPWVALRKDEALRAEIFQDVERCIPESVYFRQPATQSMLLDILFVYCKLNPDLGYRQGMHELLAPILWTIERDVTEGSVEAENGADTVDVQLASALFDSRYLEHDTFTLFGLVMQTAKSFYDPGTAGTTRALGQPLKVQDTESPILVRCRRIFAEMLPLFDPELAEHLGELQVEPQIFLLRWIRLLFGREFAYDDLLQIWDLLFAEDTSLELVDHICIAMLLRMRWQLMEADMSQILHLLVHYTYLETPVSAPPKSLVSDAIHLKANPTLETASDLIQRYTLQRPETRPPTPHSELPSPFRAASPFAPSTPLALDSILQDAAARVLSRGEKWGLNQAVRGAVGEMRKNVQALQQQAASSAMSSPRGKGRGHRNATSEVSENIAASVLRKMNALEERNRRLAALLEGAAPDLWDFFKKASEDKAADEEFLQRFGVAIAKVQFVQTLLGDSSLPLPPPETADPAPAPAVEPTPDPEPPVDAVAPPPQTSSLPHSPPTSTTSVSSQRVSVTVPPPFASVSPKNPRHRLAESSFSWMLAQQPPPLTSAPARQDVASVEAPFGAERALGKERDRARASKGFLFGEDGGEGGRLEAEEVRVRARAKRKSAVGVGMGVPVPVVGRGSVSGLGVGGLEEVVGEGKE